MSLTMGEKIRTILHRRKITMDELAKRTGQSRQNLSNKMKRDNFTETDLAEIAAALDCNLSINFQMKDTGETL